MRVIYLRKENVLTDKHFLQNSMKIVKLHPVFSFCSAFLQMLLIWKSKFYLNSNLIPSIFPSMCCLAFFQVIATYHFSPQLYQFYYSGRLEKNICQG